MSEVKHTPGPWTYTVEGDGDDFKLMGGEVYIIDGCGCCGSPYMLGPYEANARLIASAPEMLEALKIIDAYLYATADGSNEQEIVRAAIAKATGADK